MFKGLRFKLTWYFPTLIHGFIKNNVISMGYLILHEKHRLFTPAVPYLFILFVIFKIENN
jgi:hypothetical protein